MSPSSGVIEILVHKLFGGGDPANGEAGFFHAVEGGSECLHVGDFTAHEKLQRVLGPDIIAEVDQALIDDLGARLGRDVTPQIDVELARDLEVIRGPRIAHGVEQIDAAAAGDGNERVGFRRLALELHRREVKPSKRSDNFQMTELLRADVHQQVLAGRVLAVESLDRILHRRSQLAVGAPKLLQKHVAELGIGLVDADGIHKLFDVVIHGGLRLEEKGYLTNASRLPSFLAGAWSASITST
jgi:hypothetical protein